MNWYLKSIRECVKVLESCVKSPNQTKVTWDNSCLRARSGTKACLRTRCDVTHLEHGVLFDPADN